MAVSREMAIGIMGQEVFAVWVEDVLVSYWHQVGVPFGAGLPDQDQDEQEGMGQQQVQRALPHRGGHQDL